METKGIKEFIRELKKIEGTNISININDKLYGDQKLKCALCLIDDEERFGLSVQGRPIYIYKNRIVNYGVKNDIYFVCDNVMCIEITKCNRQ